MATVVEGDQKAPFSIATTPRCRGECLLLSLDCSTLPLIRTLYCWVLSKEASSTILKVFGMTRPGIEPCLPDHWRTLYPLGQWAGVASWLECSPKARETWVQSQVESYQRLKKWYLMPPWLTLYIIRYGSKVMWSNPGKGVAPSPTPWCNSNRKGSLRVTLDNGRQLYLYDNIVSGNYFHLMLSFACTQLYCFK